MKGFLLIALVLAALVLGPVLVIWSLNTLFPTLEIPITIKTVLATLVLSGTVSGAGLKAKES